MKKPALSLLILLMIMTACKKSGTPGIDGQTCKILVMSEILSGVPPNFTWFNYDSSGNLTSINDAGSGITGPQYIYEGNILRYSFSSIIYDNYFDTVFYFFDGTNKLERTIENRRIDSHLETRTTDYFYNSDKQVVLELSRVHSSLDTTYETSDSTIYNYSSNNITQLKNFERVGAGTMNSHTLRFVYDGRKNYYKAMGKPPDSYFFWSENNITETISADDMKVIASFTYLNYNESGYPTEFIINGNPVTFVITYECH